MGRRTYKQPVIPTHSQAQTESQGVLVEQVRSHSGPLPSPLDLEQYDRIVPGLAGKIVHQFDLEAPHRREMQKAAQQSNIAVQQANMVAQTRHLDLLAAQEENNSKNNLRGQVFGFIISAGCVAGAVYLASDQPYIAALLAGIPTAAVIRQFYGRSAVEKDEKLKQ